MKFVKTFEEIGKEDIAIAGGKGSSLGEMTQAGFPVPDGFVLLTNAFDVFSELGDMNADIPPEIRKEILMAFSSMDAKHAAVRSSATAEDSATDSWAGQLETYLNTTEDNLLINVKKCWQSLYSDRAKAYRTERGLDNKKISVAVIVQNMIKSEIAGVAFSVHPVTQNTDQIIIEAVRGLGDKLVSGEVTPDSYVISKDTKQILENTGDHLLSDDQIVELAEIILKIENHYGFPVDVEWAYANEKFYILQSRPITTLIELSDIETKLKSIDMVSMGKRRANKFQASIKISGWSNGLESELGVGYNVMVINSLGEQYADKESIQKIRTTICTKDFLFAKEYIKKMAELNSTLLENISKDVEADYVKGFADLFAYFFIVKHIFEYGYQSSTAEEKTYIEKWRNDVSLFSSLDLFYEKHPQQDPEKEWSSVLLDGKMHILHKVICFVKDTEYQDNFLIKGAIAYPGKVSGTVRVVLSRADVDLVQEGEIIVAPMTTVDFTPAMKKAAAFVTDEGGITSHAAIYAREMKKPCIIATKIATQVLNDGDLVEVDADNGIVRILK